MAEETIASRFEALGGDAYNRTIGAIGAAATRTGGAIERMTRMVTPLNAAIAGLAGGFTLAAIAKVGAEFENVQARMAGTLSAMKITPDFVSGLDTAQSIMESINVAAAALPGEAQDYIDVFTQTLPVVGQAVQGSMQDLTNFTNKYTAVMSGLQIQSAEASMLLNRALAAGRGALDQQSMGARTLVQQMALVEGHAGLTVGQFNKMDQSARADLIGKALSKQDDMLAHVSSKWSAVIGAVKTTQQLVTRLATSSLFEAMTASLARINSAFIDSNGQLTKFGKLLVAAGEGIGDSIAKGFDRATDAFVSFAADFEGFVKRMQDSPLVRMLDSLFSRAQALGAAVMTGGKGEGGVAGAATGAAVGMVVGGPLAALAGFVLGIDNVVAILTTLGGGLGQLYDALQPVLGTVGDALTPVLSLLVDTAISLIPALVGIAEVASVVIGALLPIVGAAVGVVSALVGFLAPAIQAIGEGFTFWKDAIQPVLTILTGLFGALALAALALTIPISPLILVIVALVAAFAAAVKFFNSNKTEYEKTRGGAEAPTGAVSGAIAGLLEKLKVSTSKAGPKSLAEVAVPKVPGAKTPSERGGTNVTQDFRNSRFTIQQKFAEGFDPDRIAVAFAKDVGELGAQRLQSGQEPQFAVR